MLVSMIVTAVVLAVEFSKYSDGILPTGTAIGVLVVICVFVAAFAWSWGPLGWLVPSEIQTLETRAAGMSSAVFINFLLSFIIGQTFVSMLCAMEWGVFLFFAGWVLIMTLFVFFFVPETRGVPVEKVQVLFAKHKIWKKVMGEHAEDVILENKHGMMARKAEAIEGGVDGKKAQDDSDSDMDGLIEERPSSVWQQTYHVPNPYSPMGSEGSGIEGALSSRASQMVSGGVEIQPMDSVVEEDTTQKSDSGKDR